MKIKIAVFGLLLFLTACSSVKKIGNDFAKDSLISNYFRGLVVYDPETGKELINENGSKYFTPASTAKLFTFYTTYRTFKDSVTALKYKQTKDSLIVLGTADPTFLYGFEDNRSLEFLKSQTQNIYIVNEEIEDDSYGAGWSWDDYAYYYMPEISLFPIYGNVVTLNKNDNGLNISPSFFKKNIKVTDSIIKIREFHSNNFYVKADEKIEDRKIPFITSNQLVADLLTKELGKKVTLVSYKNTNNFNELKSVVYDSLYKEMLAVSDNFIAEQLLLQVGIKVDTVYSVKNAINYSLENYLKDIPQKPRWVDGSGLSRYNLFTPESFVFLLNKMYREIPREKLFGYFPLEEYSNTVKNNKPVIYAKSGTLSNNYNLSGYLVTKSGKVLIFSFMNNHYQGSSKSRKDVINLILEQLYSAY